MSISQEIKGNTLRVYLYLLKNGPSELRDIQRGVGFSSPSLVSYHIGKLSEAGLVTQNEYGVYSVIKEACDRVLQGYAKVGPAIVPQFFYFAFLFTILIAFFSYAALFLSGFIPYLVAVGIAMVIVFWYETYRLFRKLST